MHRSVPVATGVLQDAKSIEWMDPATGKRQPAKSDTNVFAPPAGDHDWVLSILRSS